MAREATIFPQALGVAGTFRPEHNRAIADAIRLQMRSMGAHQGLSPVLDVCRDPRWGRCEESYGEDPQLVTAMGNSFIEGLQTADLRDGVVATAKHFVGYGASEGGLNWAPAHLPERELRDVYLRPFESAVRDPRPRLGDERLPRDRWSALRCQPMAADRPAARRVGLRRDRRVRLLHRAPAPRLPPHHRRPAHRRGGRPACRDRRRTSGHRLLRRARCAPRSPPGQLELADVDLAVARVLATKFRLGLFEQPFVDPDRIRRPSPLRRADRTGADDRRRQPDPAQERRRAAARRARRPSR